MGTTLFDVEIEELHDTERIGDFMERFFETNLRETLQLSNQESQYWDYHDPEMRIKLRLALEHNFIIRVERQAHTSAMMINTDNHIVMMATLDNCGQDWDIIYLEDGLRGVISNYIFSRNCH